MKTRQATPQEIALKQLLDRVNHIYPPASPFLDSSTGQEWLRGDVTEADIEKIVSWHAQKTAEEAAQ